LKAILLFIELIYPIEHHRDDIAALVAKLPPGSEPVFHTVKSVAVLIPQIDALEAVATPVRPLLSRFENWRFVGISGESLCAHGSWDPFEHWMNERVRMSPPRQRFKSKNVPLTQRHKIGVKGPV